MFMILVSLTAIILFSMLWIKSKPERYKKVLIAFGKGLLLALLNRDFKKTRHQIHNKFSPFYKGFAYEGAGVGIAIKTGFKMNHPYLYESLMNRLSSFSIYQNYVAYGWYSHLFCRYRVRYYEKLLKQLDKKLGIVLFDGVGFKVGFLKPNFITKTYIQRKFNLFKRVEFIRVCYQGYGRSMWFTCSFSIENVIAQIEEMPVQYRKDIYSGVGLACAYSFFDKLNEIFENLEKVPEDYRHSYIQGLAFGLEARRLQDHLYWEENINLLTSMQIEVINQLIFIVHESNRLLSEKPLSNFYIEWIELVRSMIKVGNIPLILEKQNRVLS